MPHHTAVEQEVIANLRREGRVRPGSLVIQVMDQTKTSRHEVREALRGLVDSHEVALNWHGELEPGRG